MRMLAALIAIASGCLNSFAGTVPLNGVSVPVTDIPSSAAKCSSIPAVRTGDRVEAFRRWNIINAILAGLPAVPPSHYLATYTARLVGLALRDGPTDAYMAEFAKLKAIGDSLK